MEFAGSNPDADVIKYSKAAFSKASKGNLKGAIEQLTKLKGIGPATASGMHGMI